MTPDRPLRRIVKHHAIVAIEIGCSVGGNISGGVGGEGRTGIAQQKVAIGRDGEALQVILVSRTGSILLPFLGRRVGPSRQDESVKGDGHCIGVAEFDPLIETRSLVVLGDQDFPGGMEGERGGEHGREVETEGHGEREALGFGRILKRGAAKQSSSPAPYLAANSLRCGDGEATRAVPSPSNERDPGGPLFDSVGRIVAAPYQSTL